jgi:GDP-L-fucose synthase
MAEASIFVMNLDKNTYEKETQPMLSHINVGSGIDCTIRELVETVAKIVSYEGDIVFDKTKPDGTARKLMDVSRLEKLGWKAKTNLEYGLSLTYHWFLANQGRVRK